MSEHTWRELERADMDTAAAHAFDMEHRAERTCHYVKDCFERDAEHDSIELLICDECGAGHFFKSNYCPNCGAKVVDE